MRIPRQCAILVGGLGTRLGALTADTPKPLLNCGGRPFLAWVLRELCRYGIENVLLLAGYKCERVESFVQEIAAKLPRPLDIEISREPAQAGTGGAVWHARALLDDSFMLINGDSWVDTNLACFLAGAQRCVDMLGHMLLWRTPESSRYGLVELDGERIKAFREKPPQPVPGVINGGLYVFRNVIVDYLKPRCSLEQDVLPVLVEQGCLSGQVMDGYFIDIGVPADYVRSQTEIPRTLRRPAVFFDRDGVLNEDLGWVGSIDRFNWIEGAVAAVRRVNEAGLHAFVVTNQAGVARGFYTESDVEVLNRWMEDQLLAAGATVDAVRYCPHHPDAVVAKYRRACNDRKPAPGMLQSLVKSWEVDMTRSFLIGNSDSDLAAGEAAGIKSLRFSGGDLDTFVEAALRTEI